MAENVTQDFKGTQVNMCEAAGLGVNLYEKDQLKFQKQNSMYTADWGKHFREEIAAALNMPDVHTRRAVPTGERDRLIPYAQESIVCWLTLSGLIRNLAPAAEVESTLLIAGSANYDEACSYQWSKVKSLLSAGSAFIAANMEWLTNGGKGMDKNFPQEYNDAANAYISASSAFFGAKQDLPFGTTTKVEALNSVYAKLSLMLGDGRNIHRFNKLMRDKYAYNPLLAIAQGHGISGIRFSFFDGETPVRVSTSTAIFIPGGKVFTCSSNGIMECKIAAGTYQCTITTPGYAPVIISVTIRPGVVGRKTIRLSKAAEAAVAV